MFLLSANPGVSTTGDIECFLSEHQEKAVGMGWQGRKRESFLFLSNRAATHTGREKQGESLVVLVACTSHQDCGGSRLAHSQATSRPLVFIISLTDEEKDKGNPFNRITKVLPTMCHIFCVMSCCTVVGESLTYVKVAIPQCKNTTAFKMLLKQKYISNSSQGWK